MTTPNLSQLDAVNRMLLMIKEQPVASLSTTTYSEALVALNILQDKMLEVQLAGWEYNTEKRTLPVDSDGRIPLPEGTIFVRSTSTDKHLLMKGDSQYLWDCGELANNTFADSEEVWLTKYETWENIPYPIRYYILQVSCEAFEKRQRNSAKASAWIEREIVQARSLCNGLEFKQALPTIFDNYRASTLINKNSNPIGGNVRL